MCSRDRLLSNLAAIILCDECRYQHGRWELNADLGGGRARLGKGDL